MKKVMIRFLTASMMIGALTVISFAQATERVRFAAGETSASVTKVIPASGAIDFLFNVKKGQTIEYTVDYDFKESDLRVYLGEPGDQDTSIPSASKAPQKFVVKKSGDHRLEVTNTTRKTATITLFLDIETAASTDSSGEAERIQFARGETSASATKDIPANGSIDFLFNVKRGQKIVYTIDYNLKNTDIVAYLNEPGGQDSSVTSVSRVPQKFTVKKSGDHRLEVTNTTNRKATIMLSLFLDE